MNHPKPTTLSFALAAALACATASAGEVTRVEETTTTATDATGRTTTTTTTTRFEDFDSDADGVIVEREIPATSPFAEVWVKYDADRDLRITPVEFQKWTPVAADTQRVEQTTVSTDAAGNTTTTTTVRFEELDANADGVIVQSELRPDSDIYMVWKRYDADGDLRLTPVEFKAYTVAAPTASTTVQKHTSSVVNADGSTTELTTTTKVEFTDWDKDADGVLIRSEIPTDSGFATVWTKYDADADLKITPAEFDAWLVVAGDGMDD